MDYAKLGPWTRDVVQSINPQIGDPHNATKCGFFTDAANMRALFQSQLQAFQTGEMQIKDCRIIRVHTDKQGADPRRPILRVAYSLDVRDRRRETRGSQIVYADVYLRGSSREAFSRIAKRSLASPRYGEAVALIEEHDVIVWSFPNDRRMPHLARFVDSKWIQPILRAISRESHGGKSLEIYNTRIEVIRYQPESRCTCRFELQLDPNEPSARYVVYGKTTREQRSDLYPTLAELWRWSRSDERNLGVPRPLGYSLPVCALWQEAVVGEGLRPPFFSGNIDGQLKSVACGLARLHRCQLTCSRKTPTSDSLRQAGKYARFLVNQHVGDEGVLARYINDLECTLAGLPAMELVPIHGGLRFSQLLMSGERAYVVDFDDLSCGDPMTDLSSMILDICANAASCDDGDRLIDTLLCAYTDESKREIPLNRLEWHVKCQAMKLHARDFRVARRSPS